MCIITFSWSTTVARQGGHVGPLGSAIDALASLNYISIHAAMSIIAICKW
jgi:hypothetical protein